MSQYDEDDYLELCQYVAEKVGLQPSWDDVDTLSDGDLTLNEVKLVTDMIFNCEIVFRLPEDWKERL